jgi:hypothetical protein
MVEDPRLFVGGGDRFDINQVSFEGVSFSLLRTQV